MNNETAPELGQIEVGVVGRDDGIYIGRGSPYGNPYRIDFNPLMTRDDVLRDYRSYLDDCMELRSALAEDKGIALRRAVYRLAHRVAKGENLVLVCYCNGGQACHGTILRDEILERAKNIQAMAQSPVVQRLLNEDPEGTPK